jgi:hypothetical protein
MIVRRNVVLLGGVVLLAGIAIYLLTGGGGERTQRQTDPSNPGAVDSQEPERTRISDGPEGSRDLDEVPHELPVGILLDDASGFQGRAARSGDDWSAIVSYTTNQERDEAEAALAAVLADEGFERRRVSFTDERRVIVHDGADGTILTLTLTDQGDGVTVAAAIVSP